MFEIHLSHVVRGDHARTIAESAALMSVRPSTVRRRRSARRAAAVPSAPNVWRPGALAGFDIVPGPTSTVPA